MSYHKARHTPQLTCSAVSCNDDDTGVFTLEKITEGYSLNVQIVFSACQGIEVGKIVLEAFHEKVSAQRQEHSISDKS